MLRANQPLLRVFKGLNRTYDNAIQSGAQIFANMNARHFETQKKHIMNLGNNHYRHLRNDFNAGNQSLNYMRMRQLGGEMELDRRLNAAHEAYRSRHEAARRTQNYLTSDQFKQDAVTTLGVAGVVGGTALMSE